MLTFKFYCYIYIVLRRRLYTYVLLVSDLFFLWANKISFKLKLKLIVLTVHTPFRDRDSGLLKVHITATCRM